jgi:subtilisin
LRIAEYDINAGRGIKIGVIDTGLGEHESLTHAIYYEPIVSYEVLEFIEVGRSDLANHGTSVCGLIGARPPDGARDQHLAGVAPGVELHCVGVLKPDEVEARLPERLVGEAIRFLCDEKECDLLNLSFAADLGKPARILRNFVNDAFDAGCLSICAAGNCGALSGRRKSNVCAPAKYARSISVSALGKDGTGPECQPSPFKDPHDRTTWAQSGLYLATFSSRGREVFCSAPGVNLIAPNDVIARDIGPYSYVEGTSYSAPLVCGALAVELARREDFLALPRTARRSRKAREILRSICENIGVPTHLFGHGLPSVGNGNGPQPA